MIEEIKKDLHCRVDELQYLKGRLLDNCLAIGIARQMNGSG